MTTHDAIVVGAGVTGLTTAWRLAQEGADVLVLEARDRVGGRLLTERHGERDQADFEVGGQWVSPDQTALLGLLGELGLQTFPRYRTGESLYVDADGSARRFTAHLPVPEKTAGEIERLTAMLDALTAQIDPDRPWSHPDAAHLDSISFRSWLAEHCEDPEARDNVALYVGPAMLTKPAHSFSALQALLMAASAGAFSHLVDADFILDRRVVGGLATVPRTLAERLGDRVLVDHDVTSVEWGGDESETAVVRVGAREFRARRVVLAVPPPVLRRIRFVPELPAEHRMAREHQSFGLVIKVQVAYESPFWRERGLSGTGFGPYQLVHEVYDNTPEGEERGFLVGFVSDLNADAVGRLEPAQRRERILQSLVTYFGDRAGRPQIYVESDWQHQELTGGAYGTSFDLGGLTRYGARLREPVGMLDFGSSDVAGLGFQHVDGAIRVGQQIATRLTAGLTPA